VVSVILAVLVILALVRSPGRAARLVMATTGLLSFWVLTVLARGAAQGSQNRYLYPASALVLVAAAELPSLLARNAPRHRPTTRTAWIPTFGGLAMAGIVAYAALAIWWNASSLISGDGGLAQNSAVVQAELGAVALAGHVLPSTYRPNTLGMPQVKVGPFLRAVATFGSPGESRGAIESEPGPIRSAVDAMLLRGRPLTVSRTEGLTSDTAHHCQRHTLGSTDPTLTFTLALRGTMVTSPQDAYLAIRARSLSNAFSTEPLAIVAPGRTSLLTWSALSKHLNWYVQLAPIPSPGPAPPGTSVNLCPVAGPSQEGNARLLRS
jgi:hypothetical protein